MTECCDDYGKCTRGKDCPARPAMFEIPQPTKPAADLARRTNEYIRRIEAGRAHLLTLKTPLRIRAWDWAGDLCESAKRGFLSAFRDAWFIVTHPWAWIAAGLVAAGYAVSGVLAVAVTVGLK